MHVESKYGSGHAVYIAESDSFFCDFAYFGLGDVYPFGALCTHVMSQGVSSQTAVTTVDRLPALVSVLLEAPALVDWVG